MTINVTERRAIRRQRRLGNLSTPQVQYQQTCLPVPCSVLSRHDLGIVTGGNSVHWPCIGALAIGACRAGIGFAVADHGLEGWQRDELERVGVRWVEHETPSIEHAQNKHTVSALKAWWKPWICEATPFADSLWIDADAVLAADPSELWASPHYAACSLVSDQTLFMKSGAVLYRDIARHFFGEANAKRMLPKYENLNTGVIAFTKGHPVIADWKAWSIRCLANNDILEMIKVRDQTSFLLVMMDREILGQPVPQFMPLKFNTPVDYLTSTEVSQRSRYQLDPGQLLSSAAERHPNAVVVHWLGRYKPWY